MQRHWLMGAVGCLAAAVLFVGLNLRAADDREAKDARLFELRIYTTHPGKLEDLNKRFREHTNRLFEKHGMELIAYWTPVEGEQAENTLVYVLAYPNREARDKAWEGFRNDPDWHAARTASEQAGPIVLKVESQLLTPTDYSPMK